ncbi:MAG: hypothetical protein AAFQ39_01415 [Pseudomonadota bacterium]
MQSDNQYRTDGKPGDPCRDGNGATGEAHDPRWIGSETEILSDVLFAAGRLWPIG